MAITFHPSPGLILLCDFSPGFKEPEMVKTRPLQNPQTVHADA